jgi:hypothetical protein
VLLRSPFTGTLVVSFASLTSRGSFHDLSLTKVKAEPSEYPVRSHIIDVLDHQSHFMALRGPGNDMDQIWECQA